MLFWHPLSFYIRTRFIYQAKLVLIYVVFSWPTFSLMFLIHFFLYAGVYCMQNAYLYILVKIGEQPRKKHLMDNTFCTVDLGTKQLEL